MLKRYEPRATGDWEEFSYNLETGEQMFTWEDGTAVSAPPVPAPINAEGYWAALKFWCAAHPWESI